MDSVVAVDTGKVSSVVKERQRILKYRLLILGLIALCSAYLYLVGFNDDIWSPYIREQRLIKGAAVLLVGYTVGIASLLFQTVTNNRILTPGVIGLDQLYVLIQGIGLYFLGTTSSAQYNFWLCAVVMIVFSMLLFYLVFCRGQGQLYLVLLVGVVCGIFFKSLYTFIMALLAPDTFSILQSALFADFSSITLSVLLGAMLFTLVLTLYGMTLWSNLDVLLLGEEAAFLLGVYVRKVQVKLLGVIAAAVAVSTALVGPITFLGLMTVNITYYLMPTYRHRYLVPAVVLVTWATLFGGLFVTERVLNLAANLTVIINGVGGVYFLWLLIGKERT